MCDRAPDVGYRRSGVGRGLNSEVMPRVYWNCEQFGLFHPEVFDDLPDVCGLREGDHFFLPVPLNPYA